VQQLVDLGRDLGLRLLADPQAERDVVAQAHVLERGVVLEDEADAALLRRQPRRVGAAHDDRAGVGHLEAGDHAQQRRLARAARPEQRGQPAVGRLERDVVEGGEVAEALGDGLDGDHDSDLRDPIRLMASRVVSAISASSADAA
jgi:hypothetical protein